jgi:alkaline phosphatase D
MTSRRVPFFASAHPLRFAATFLLIATLAHAGELISGPMLGYRARRETALWLETKNARTVTLTYQLAGKPETARTLTHTAPAATPAGVQPQTFILPLLDMGAAYEYSVTIDGTPVTRDWPFTFTTAAQWEWRTPPPDFKFLFGTCAYLNDEPYDRPGTPYGKGTTLFKHMAESGANFMLWAGDNWYYREGDFDSVSGLWYRASHDRATADLQKLYGVMHHYATWDDHDYGSNDANKSYELKGTTLDIFKAYWPNQTFGQPDNPGVHQKFVWGDAMFIMMDNRYHRDDTLLEEKLRPNKSQYGAQQLEWLKQSLLQAKSLDHYTFKFIVTGGQVITSFGGSSETFDYFRHEREEILQFIKDHQITGVIFLSGDVHFSELAREKIDETQYVYELTSSPLSSGVSSRAAKERADDPQRVPGTFLNDQNYCAVAISGPKDDRSVTISCFDKTNTKRWEHVIKASELK